MTKPNDLEKYANSANWPNTLGECKTFATEAVQTWKWKKKAPEFIKEIEGATSIKRVQEIVIYPLLSGEGLAVHRGRR
jgi:hypothetical protein